MSTSLCYNIVVEQLIEAYCREMKAANHRRRYAKQKKSQRCPRCALPPLTAARCRHSPPLGAGKMLDVAQPDCDVFQEEQGSKWHL